MFEYFGPEQAWKKISRAARVLRDASGGVLYEGYGHIGSGICLDDGQTEAEGVPSQGGRGDALLRCTPPHLT